MAETNKNTQEPPKAMTTIKTRFGNLQLVGANDVIQVTLTTEELKDQDLKTDTPLITTLIQSDNLTTITATPVKLIDVIKPVVTDYSTETTIPNTLVENIVLTPNNKLAIDTSQLVDMPINIPIATTERIGGVRSINSTTLLNSIKVHQEETTITQKDGTKEVIAPGWMEVNSLSTDKLEQIKDHWLVLDSVDAAANWDGTETK